MGLVFAQDEEGAIGVPDNAAPSTQSDSKVSEGRPEEVAIPELPSTEAPIAPPVVNSSKFSEAENAEEESSNEIQTRDLEAQESMARAAWAMFWSALVQVLIGAGSIVFIFWTLRETRRTLTEAEKATRASQDAADAARRSIVVSRDIADAQARPWVSVECFLSEGFRRYTTHLGVDGVSLNIHAIAKNHGNSPATNVIFRAEIGIPTDESGDLMTAFCDRFRDIPDQTLDAIFPGESKEFSHSVFLPVDDILAHVSDKDFKAVCPVVYGLIHYKSHHTTGIRQTRFHYGLSEIRDGGCFVFTPDVDN